MKLFKIILFIILLIISILFTYQFVNYYFQLNYIKNKFKLNNCFSLYEMKIIKEEWTPNGDGTKLVLLKYNKNDTCKIDTSFKKLPIEEKSNSIILPLFFKKLEKGYYKLIIDKEDERNYEILIINNLKNEIYVYYDFN